MKKILLSLAVAGLPVLGFAQGISQDFESASSPALPSTWTNTKTGAGNGWETSPSDVDLYPSSAGYYVFPATSKIAFVNDGASPANYPAYMTSPTFSISGLSAPFLAYDYNFFAARLTATSRSEAARVELSTDGGSTYTTIDTIKYTGGVWMKKYVSLASYASATNCKLRFMYTDNRVSSADTAGILGVAVDNIKVYSPNAKDIAFATISPLAGDPAGAFQTVGGNVTFGGTAFNNSSSTITSFNVTYKVGAAAAVTTSVTGVSIAPFTSYTFTSSTPYTMGAIGTQNVVMYLTLTGDTSRNNDTLRTAVTGVSSFPKKRPLFEEGTGAWCGYCVRGIVYMDSLWKLNRNDCSIIAVHNRSGASRWDGMQPNNATTIAYDAYFGTKISGYPSMVSDRLFVSSVGSNVFGIFNELKNWYGFAEMNMSASAPSTTLNASVTIKPTTNLTGDYRLALVVTEDDVHDATNPEFRQANYYSGGGQGPLSGGGVNYVTEANPISQADMYYQFVARYSLPTFNTSATNNGIAGSLPATMTAGTSYSYTFDPITILSSWNKAKLRVVVMLIDNNPSSPTYGMSLNTVNNMFTLGVDNVAAGITGMSVYPNPAVNNINVTFGLDNSSNVSTTVFDVAGRVVYTGANQKMNAGTQTVNISVADLTTGIYTVVIGTDKGTVTERFSVTK